MKKKTGYKIYIAIVLILCLVPLLGLAVRPTTQTTENKKLTEWPALVTQDGINVHFLEEAGNYFTDHFAFRQELVAADASIRSGVFEVSAVDSVIVGENGWLYYEATLDDYQHKNSVSDRMLFNIAHNLSLMQQYAQLLGKDFVFTIAPNKNSLYGENMPDRYQYQIAELSDRERLEPWLLSEQVNYVDLYRLFEAQDEVLYYERDSHWNNKGAVMVYGALMEAAGLSGEDYEALGYEVVDDYYGDLNLMLYPLGAEQEQDMRYNKEFTWNYTTGSDVTDQYIQTVCPDGTGNLLMYRDSFGNTLLPYFAQTFSQATFSQIVPYQMTDLITAAPDVVILEKVERHLPTLGKVTPVMSGILSFPTGKETVYENGATMKLSKEGSYWKFSGIADASLLDVDSRIYLEVSDGNSEGIYEAFCVELSENGETSDFGYQLYLSEVMLNGSAFEVRVMAQKADQLLILYEGTAEQ